MMNFVSLRTTQKLLMAASASVCIVGCAAGLFGQRVLRGIPSNESEPEVLDVFLPAPRDLKQHLNRAQRALDQQNYSDAVDELGSILIPRDDGWGLGDAKAEDFFIGRGGEEGTQTSLKAEAQRLLGSMPAKGRESFELQFGADARALLDQGIEQGDIQKLTDVTRMYFHTRAGYEATMLLGRHHLDQGRPLAAALCFKRMVESPAAGPYEPELSLLLATCWLHASQPQYAQAVLVALQDRMPQATVRAGGNEFELFRHPADALPWLTKIVGSGPLGGDTSETQWLVYRGDATRNARTGGGMPVRNYRWFLSTVNDLADEERIEDMRRQFLDDLTPALPGLHPLAVGNWLLMRTPRSLFGVNFETGKRVWEFPWERPESASDQPSQTHSHPMPDALASSRRSELNQRLWDDAPYGQVSSDGQFVFLLDDLGFAMPTGFPVTIMAGGFRRSNEDWSRSNNKLVALSLEKEGALTWIVGGPDGEDEPRLAGAFFLGAPLPLSGQLYVLAEINGEIRLVVLRARTGKLEWSQQLAHVEMNPIVQDGPRRLAGASPSFADGVLVCPTSTGAVVAVDLSTRALLWGFQYKKALVRGRRSLPQYSRQPNPLGQRWMDSTVTIAEGRVVVTPVESEQMYCLDLISGESLWPNGKDRGDLLYVACIDQDRVVTVGKHEVTALQLVDGQQAWTLKFEQGAMPSGRGFFSDHDYFLPTTQSRLLKIDLSTGDVVESAETNFVLGNLICYKGEVISQGVDRLAVFHQEQPLRLTVHERLQKNPDDVWALARQGELLLMDGKRPQALAVLRRAFQLEPDKDSTRELLVKSLLVALRDDYVANQQLAKELEQLIDQPARQAEFLRLKAMGLLKAGKTMEAFGAFLRMTGWEDDEAHHPPTTSSRLEQVEHDLKVRLDRWIMRRLSELYLAADASQRRQMDETIQARMTSAVKAGSSEDIRRFLDYFGFHPHADQARLALIDNLVSAGDLLPAELLLNDVVRATGVSVAAAADARLARLLEAAGHLRLAADQYRHVAETWSQVVCLEGKTGKQLLEAIPSDSAIGRMIEHPATWPLGEIEVTQGAETVGNLNASVYRVLHPTINMRQRRGMLSDGLHVVFNQGNNSVTLRDGLGKELTQVSLSTEPKQNRTFTFSSINSAVAHCQVNGHLLLLTMGFEIVAIDLTKMAKQASDAILWRQDLTQAIPDPLTQSRGRLRVGSRSIQNIWGVTEHFATDSSGRLLGDSASVHANGFCFLKQRELVCVDPISGEVIWARTGLEPGSGVFGDTELVFVTPPNERVALVYDALDGTFLGRRKIAESANRWVSQERYILSWKQRDNQLELSFDDVWEQTANWTKSFPIGSKGCMIQHDEIAVMQPDGRFVLWSLMDGIEKVDMVHRPQQILSNIHVQKSLDQYILITNNPGRDTASDATIRSAPDPRQAPLVNGYVYAFDRSTGEPQWDAPVRVAQFGFPLEQPTQLPVLTFMRHMTLKTGNPRARQQTSILCLDKRTGRIIHQDDAISSLTHHYHFEGAPQEKTIQLRLPGRTFTLRLTDRPSPPSEHPNG